MDRQGRECKFYSNKSFIQFYISFNIISLVQGGSFSMCGFYDKQGC